MLIGSFFAVLVGYWRQSLGSWASRLGISGCSLAIPAYLIIYLKTEPIVVGIGGNRLAWGSPFSSWRSSSRCGVPSLADQFPIFRRSR